MRIGIVVGTEVGTGVGIGAGIAVGDALGFMVGVTPWLAVGDAVGDAVVRGPVPRSWTSVLLRGSSDRPRAVLDRVLHRPRVLDWVLHRWGRSRSGSRGGGG